MVVAPSSTNPPETTPRESGHTLHQRETRLQIWLPFMGAVLLVLAVTALVGLNQDAQAMLRISALTDIMVMLMVLCPAFICLLPIYVLLVAGIYGMHRLHNGVGTPLERLENATEKFAQRVERTADRVNKGTVNWSARFAIFAPVLNWFDTPEENPNAKSSDPTRLE